MSFDPNTSVLAGMTTDQLNAALASAQAAYLALSTGAMVATVAYAQGDGQKSVTYRAAAGGLAGLTQLIKLLQAQLGIIRHERRAIPVTFG